jgi:hypothetical protein
LLVGTIAVASHRLCAISFRGAQTVTQVERVALDPPASSIARSAGIVLGWEHVKAFAMHPTEWSQRVFAFLNRELGPEKPVVGAAGILAAPRRGG